MRRGRAQAFAHPIPRWRVSCRNHKEDLLTHYTVPRAMGIVETRRNLDVTPAIVLNLQRRH